ncbi:MAG: tetratricopeptide repeat protein [Christensenella sp.]
MEKQNLKIVEFERPASFYFRAALSMMDGMNYLGALSMVRKAVEKEPKNMGYMMKQAEILTELSKYEESNSILFEILLKTKNVCGECYFGMGCNFIGMGDVDKAEESFEKYLAVEPDGEFCDDVEEFLALFCDDEDEDEYILEDVSNIEQQELAQQGKQYLDSCEYQKAAEVLEKIHDSKDMLFAKNNLALSYYCMKKTDKAIEAAKKALAVDPDNIHANCNMAMFLHKQDPIAARKYVAKAVKQPTNTQDDFYKIAITYCEMGEHEDALRYLTNILATSPYDEKVLFCAAMADFNIKRYAEAVNYLSDILRLEPNDSIAAYYLKYVKDVMDKKQQHTELGYVFQVPPKEAKARIQYLNDCIKLPQDEFKQRWKTDKKLKDVLVWGLEYGDTFIKHAAVEIIGGFADAQAERIFRRYILRRNQPDAIKNEVFVSLKCMNAKEPYVAYFNEGVVEVKVGMLDNIEETDVERFDKLFDLIVSVVSENYSEQLAGKAVSILQEYTEHGNGNAYLSKYKELAAGVTFAALYLSDITAEPKKIAIIFDADVNILSSIAMEIINTIGNEKGI